MSKKLRIGVIGCGQIAQHHFKTWAGIEDAEVVACADIKPEAADAAARNFGIPNVYYNAFDLLKRDDIDAVDICLHNNLHVSGAVAALEAGKHVYCEKPMAGSYKDAVTMLETARRLNKKLHIQLAQLYSDETRAAKDLIDAGELGKLYHARSTGFRRRGRPYVDGYGNMPFVQKQNSGGGALYDMGVYHISAVLYLLGNPRVERVTGKTYQEIAMDPKRKEAAGYSVEELGTGFVRFENNISLDIIEAWAINLDKIEGSVVVGSEGGVRLDPFGFFKNVGLLDMNATADMGNAHFKWDMVRGDGAHYSESQRHWTAALLGRAPLLPTAEIALNTMLIQQGIYLSESLGREVSADEIRAASVSTAIPL